MVLLPPSTWLPRGAEEQPRDQPWPLFAGLLWPQTPGAEEETWTAPSPQGSCIPHAGSVCWTASPLGRGALLPPGPFPALPDSSLVISPSVRPRTMPLGTQLLDAALPPSSWGRRGQTDADTPWACLQKIDCPCKWVCLRLSLGCFHVYVSIQLLFPTQKISHFIITQINVLLNLNSCDAHKKHVEFDSTVAAPILTFSTTGAQDPELPLGGGAGPRSCRGGAARPPSPAAPRLVLPRKSPRQPPEERTFSTARRKPCRSRPQSWRPLACPPPRGAPSFSSIAFSPAVGRPPPPPRLAGCGRRGRRSGGGGHPAARWVPQPGRAVLTAASQELHRLAGLARLSHPSA